MKKTEITFTNELIAEIEKRAKETKKELLIERLESCLFTISKKIAPDITISRDIYISENGKVYINDKRINELSFDIKDGVKNIARNISYHINEDAWEIALTERKRLQILELAISEAAEYPKVSKFFKVVNGYTMEYKQQEIIFFLETLAELEIHQEDEKKTYPIKPFSNERELLFQLVEIIKNYLEKLEKKITPDSSLTEILDCIRSGKNPEWEAA